MLALLLLILVAAPQPYAAPGAYRVPPRCPDQLLASDLSDVEVRVWLAVRSVQGDNDRAWAKTATYADRAGKHRVQVSRSLKTLVEAGWIAVVGQRGRTSEYACLVPGSKWSDAPAPAPSPPLASVTESYTECNGELQTSVTESYTECNGELQTPTPPYKDQSVKGIQGVGVEDAREGSQAKKVEVDQLPTSVVVYREQIAERMTLPEADRERWGFRVLGVTSGHVVEARRDLAERLARDGPLPVVAALVVADNEATARRYDSRLRFLDSVLDTISDHARRSSLPPAPQTEAPSVAGGPTRGGGRGAGGVRRTAAERASTVTIAGNLDLLDRYGTLGRSGGDAGDAPDSTGDAQ